MSSNQVLCERAQNLMEALFELFEIPGIMAWTHSHPNLAHILFVTDFMDIYAIDFASGGVWRIELSRIFTPWIVQVLQFAGALPHWLLEVAGEAGIEDPEIILSAHSTQHALNCSMDSTWARVPSSLSSSRGFMTHSLIRAIARLFFSSSHLENIVQLLCLNLAIAWSYF